MTATMPMDKLCTKMRCLVHDCLAKHLYDSAIFYADKLVTMSRSADADVYTLAEVTAPHVRCLCSCVYPCHSPCT